MANPFAASDRIAGVDIPRRRFTRWAAWFFFIYVAAPILGLGLLLDVVFYLIFAEGLETCYGLLCLTGQG